MNTLKFLKEIVGNKKKLYLSVVLAFLVGRIFDLFLPLIFKFLLDYSSEYVNGKTDNYHIILVFSVLLIVVAFISRFAFRFFDFFEAKFIPLISAEIPIKIFKYITNHSTSFFDNNFSGEIAQKIKQINDISKSLLIAFPANLLATIITLAVTISVILPKSVFLGLIILFFGIIYFFISYLLANKNKELSALWSDKNSQFNGQLIDSIENMILVKSFSKKDFEINKINDFALQEKDTLFNLKINVTKIKLLHTIISSSIIIIVTFYSLYLYLNGLMSLGDFVFNYTIITRLTNEFYMIGELSSDMLEKYGIFKSAIGFIYKKQQNDSQKPNIKIKDGAIEIKNIDFKYNGNYIFKGFDFKVKSREKVAIVGASGGGKSTIMKIILKQYPIESGEVLIDNQNIKGFNSDSLNNQITYINQNVYLFNRSIRDNIMYVKPEATQEELILACQKSGCLEFITNKKDGFDTIVGERGVQLSGGEKQRIALARAFLLNNPILILDEPTSALDLHSEAIIQESLVELMKNKTVIIIAHRLSTIKNMDRVVVLDSGNIVEFGTHQELIEKHGAYKSLWDKQFFD